MCVHSNISTRSARHMPKLKDKKSCKIPLWSGCPQAGTQISLCRDCSHIFSRIAKAYGQCSKMSAVKIFKTRRSSKILPRRKSRTDSQNIDNEGSRPCENDCKALVNLVQEFGQETTFHGVNVMLAPGVGKFERALSTITFITAFILLVCVCLFLASRFSKGQFKTVVEDTHFPLYKVKFPEVTICNKNRLNWSRLQAAKAQFLMPEHHNTSNEKLFIEIISLYNTFTFGGFNRFARLEKYPLYELNYVNFTAVARFMAWRCWDILADCKWRSHPRNCCDIFVERRSQLGFCLAFNSVEGPRAQINDSSWPLRTNRGGIQFGLSVKVSLSKQNNFFKSHERITVMIVEPNAWYYIPMDISSQTRTHLTLGGFLNKYDDETRRVSSNERGCVFKDEQNSDDFKTLYGHAYRFENCHSQCQQEHLIKYCNCTLDIFFPPSPFPYCKLVDLPCLAKHNNYLLNFEIPGQEKYMTSKYPGIVCSCHVSCDSLRYFVAIKSIDLTSAESVANASIVHLNVYFEKDFITKYKTILVFTWIDLIVSFGGTTGLFLGCSLISLVELVYFFFFVAPRRLKKEHERPHHLKRRPSRLEQSKIKLREYREVYKAQQKY